MTPDIANPGDPLRSDCTACGWRNARCWARVLKGDRPCCGRCHLTETHPYPKEVMDVINQEQYDYERLTPTQQLIMEVLGARRRLNERLWPFNSHLRLQGEKLAEKGLVNVFHGTTERTFRASLTETGLKMMLDPEYVVKGSKAVVTPGPASAGSGVTMSLELGDNHKVDAPDGTRLVAKIYSGLRVAHLTEIGMALQKAACPPDHELFFASCDNADGALFAITSRPTPVQASEPKVPGKITTAEDFAAISKGGWSGCMHDSDCACSDMAIQLDAEIIDAYLLQRDGEPLDTMRVDSR